MIKQTLPVKKLHLREKLATLGPNNLADAELLAVFLSSGTSQRSCLDLAYELIGHFGDLRGVLNAEGGAFQKIPGLGPVRYLQLQAAKEICKRSDYICLQQTLHLHTSGEVHAFMKRQLRDKKNETFAALFLDSQNRVLRYEELFFGTINQTTIHPRPIVQKALSLNAAAILFAHNHPSGNAKASEQDKIVTAALMKAMELIDVKFLDHLVIGDNEVFSILEEVCWSIH